MLKLIIIKKTTSKITVSLAFLLTLMLGATPSFADSKTVHLTSLGWPPYSGKKLPNNGPSIEVAKAAFKAMGYELVVDFYPWSRAVALAKDTGSKYAGYFPEYYSDGVAKEFHYSGVMGNGPLGFAQQTAKPISWATLDDIGKLNVGVVQDYVNTTEFDARVADGRIKAKAVTSDSTNLVKLANGRLDLAVVDQNVMDYLKKTDARLKSVASKIEFNSKLLEDKKLYVCFKKNAEGKRLQEIFDQGLTKIDVAAIMKNGLGQ